MWNRAGNLKQLGLVAVLAAGLLGVGAASAQKYPDKPVRMVVPFPPGGGLDTVARVVASELSKQLGQNVVVDNRGGASGVIGVSAAVRAPADGYTILFASSDTLTVLPLMKKLPFDAATELTPIAKVADLYIVFASNPAVPVKSIQDVIEMAKKKPGQLSFASPGTGSVSHMTFEGFKLMTGTDIRHVPYNGGGPAQIGVIGGQIELLSGGANLYKAIGAGRLRGLSISAATRNPLLPDVPTLVESGVKDFVFSSWFGVFVGAQTPEPIVKALATALRETTQTAEFKTKVEAVGGTPTYLAGKELIDYMKSESDRWKVIVDGAKIKMD
jgi:tripartite-type tricarboxylate transporter receptor subunit TctC